MPLVLTIVRQPEGANLTDTRKLFTEAGGTLGRAADNSWSLPDPSRFVSSHHASIRYDHGDFYLVDTSTNGVYVNTNNAPLGTGNQVRLQTGDKLYLGEYEIHVEFEQAGNDAGPMSSDDLDQWLGPEETEGSVAGDSGDLLTPEQELLDPLAALDKAHAPAKEPWGGSAASQADNAAVPNQAFVAPEPIPESQAPAAGSGSAAGGGVIPDDWDLDDLLSDETPMPDPEPPAPAASVHTPTPPPAKELIPDDIDDIDALLEGPEEEPLTPDEQAAASDSDELDAFLGIDGDEEDDLPLMEEDEPAAPAPEPAAVEPPAEPVVTTPPPSPEPPQPPAPPIPEPPQSPAAPRQPVPESLLDSSQPQSAAPAPTATAQTCDELIRSMGLDPTRMDDETRNHFQTMLAETLRETVAGMMKVLGARNAIKNEFRMNVTMIQPVENNPLKFSPNVDEALRNMFTSQTNAYLPGTVAIQEGFEDIADHQVAVIAGMRAAFRSLLKRFDPAELQVRFDKQHKAGLLGSKKGKYWEAYAEFYNDLADNMDDAFQDLFGEDFAEAYEQQMSRLEASRKHK